MMIYFLRLLDHLTTFLTHTCTHILGEQRNLFFSISRVTSFFSFLSVFVCPEIGFVSRMRSWGSATYTRAHPHTPFAHAEAREHNFDPSSTQPSCSKPRFIDLHPDTCMKYFHMSCLRCCNYGVFVCVIKQSVVALCFLPECMLFCCVT